MASFQGWNFISQFFMGRWVVNYNMYSPVQRGLVTLWMASFQGWNCILITLYPASSSWVVNPQGWNCILIWLLLYPSQFFIYKYSPLHAVRIKTDPAVRISSGQTFIAWWSEWLCVTFYQITPLPSPELSQGIPLHCSQCSHQLDSLRQFRQSGEIVGCQADW